MEWIITELLNISIIFFPDSYVRFFKVSWMEPRFIFVSAKRKLFIDTLQH